MTGDVKMERKKILVVDDEPDIARTIKLRLEMEGYEVSTAKDGQEGLEAVKRFNPGLIVLDLVMPVMDGIQMSGALKRDPQTKDIPILFLTCLYEKKDELRLGHESGGNLFLAKPFDGKELLSMVKKLLG
jgi:CheY-like chemotaxis protein